MKNLLLFCSMALILACNSAVKENNEANSSNKLRPMEWVIGNWEYRSPQSDLVELWSKLDDSTYNGKSYMISKGDTVFYETMLLGSRMGELLYIPTVREQNGPVTVLFKFISDNNGEITFENKDHDFPQRVIYKSLAPDSLYARVEGDDKGKFRKEEFRMARSK